MREVLGDENLFEPWVPFRDNPATAAALATEASEQVHALWYRTATWAGSLDCRRFFNGISVDSHLAQNSQWGNKESNAVLPAGSDLTATTTEGG